MLQKENLKSAKTSSSLPLSPLENLSEPDIQKLKNALVRYDCLAGLNVAVTRYQKELLSVDRKNFKRFMPKASLSVSGLMGQDSERCIKFLREVTGCDLESCKVFLISYKEM